MTATATAREATPADNDALVELSVACPMEGDIGLAIDRAPDFFVLNRLEGRTWQVGVVDGPDGRPIGCIAIAGRDVYVNGEPRPAMYISDLKVHPAHRGGGAADALVLWARDACVAAHGPDVLAFLTVLAGNKSMLRRMEGPRGLPVIERVATFRSHTIPILWRRRPPPDGTLTVVRAQPADVEEMAGLWAGLIPARQFAAVHDAASLAGWIDGAPGLDLNDYRVARRPDGTLAGFLGVWDQSGFKRLRVTGYSRRLGAVRVAFNAVAPLTGATKLPAPGGALRNLTAVHVCAPPEDLAVLRALVLDAYNANRARGYSFLNIGLDVTDPLAAGLKGLLAQPTDVWVCVATLGGPPPPLDGRPSHHELALV
ncbi:MAG: GNAT family N-acetyltransferase [Acidimicrobiales bacterium]